MFTNLTFPVIGKQVFSYNQELPLKSTVSAMAFHPSEQMAVFTAYGRHEPIVVLVHKNDLSDPAVVPTDAATQFTTKTKLEQKKISEDVTEKTLKKSTRFRDIARTLNTVTAFTASSQ